MIKKYYVYIKADGYSFMKNDSEIMFVKPIEWLWFVRTMRKDS